MSIQFFEIPVLLVEPFSAQHRIICTYLTELDVTNVRWAKTGKLALESMRKERPGLGVSAMHLEDMTGAELVQDMLKDGMTEALPFMLVSSEKDESRIASVQQAGISAPCDKPFESSTVKQIIERIVA